MGTRKFEKLILSSAKSKDDIVAEALAEIKNYEAKDPANDYVCSVIHAYDDGDNAGDQYIVINEKLRVEYGLKGNAVASSHYSRADIKAMIDAVDAKIPLDPAKEALLKEVESIEADIRAKEAQLPPKEKELRNLKQQKATIEQEIADLNSLIAEARAEGRSTTVLEASKAQREADLAAKNREISTLEGQINEIKRQIPLLKEQAKNKQTQQESIKSPELATKVYVDELKASLDSDIATKANQDTTYTKTEVDDIANTKANQDTTYTKTEVDDIANTKANQDTTYTKTEVDDIANTKANQDTTYTKTEVDTRVNAKANANATVNLTGNQTIAGVKTFSAPPVSATNPTANNQVANKAYVDSVGNAKVALTGNQTIAGVKTFSSPPVSATQPTANNQVANKAYVDSRLGRAYITETYVNGMSWYRVWSDKWCEQGGPAPTQIVTLYRGTVTLLKAYKDTNYSIFTVVSGGKSESIWGSDNSIGSITRTGFQMNTQNNGTINCRNWYTCGYIS